MAGEVPLAETLSFDRAIEYSESDPALEKAFYSFVNWCATNRKGMTFSFLFGAAFLTLLPTLQIKPTKSVFKNSLIGTLTGAPLGVCVNCAAPIGNAIYKALGKVEISLATMLSSPTLNVVVLTMLFTMFPAHLIVLKLFFTVFTLLVVIPFVSARSKGKDPQMQPQCLIEGSAKDSTTWLSAIFQTAKSYAKNLIWIVVATGPLMILAGALGVGLTEVVDLQHYTQEFSFWGLALVALVGTFLPAPIALDLILAQAFMIAGVNDAYVMALLFTLGIYSIYSCFIVWKSISRKIAISLYASTVILGIASGYIAKIYIEFEDKESLEIFDQEFSEIFSMRKAFAASKKSKNKNPNNIPSYAKYLGKQKDVKLYQASFKPRKRHNQNFKMHWAEDVGIHRPIDFSVLDFFPPFFFSRGMTAGDYNNDGWEDVAIATNGGIRLYTNHRGKFTETHINNITGLTSKNLMLTAFVDINNDGWLDLFGSSYGNGEVFYLKNIKGHFSRTAIKIPNPKALIANSASFADYDTDGDLDIAIGNWNMGFVTKRSPNRSGNHLAINTRGRFLAKALPSVPGETLTTLFSDINTNGNMDLVVGNDFSRPDIFYMGDNKGNLVPSFKGNEDLVPVTTKYTMSVDTADINNDLKLDMYLAQISGSFGSSSADDFEDYDASYCKGISNKNDYSKCMENIRIKDITMYRSIKMSQVKQCKKIRNRKTSKECMIQVLTLVALKEDKPQLCKRIPSSYSRNKFLCENYFKSKPSQRNAKDDYVEQIEKRNVMLVADKDGDFEDKAQSLNVDYTGYSWNAKFADLDNDGWQDIYIANGTWLTPKRNMNTLLMNKNGQKFVKPPGGYGLDDSMDVYSYVYIDYDNDGDLDLLTAPINAPLKLFENREAQNNLITFSFKDSKANSHCIGCKIIATLDDGTQQIREIKGGGGFQSFDAPKAHFGLGKVKGLKAIEVQWSDGENTKIRTSLKANRHLFITR